MERETLPLGRGKIKRERIRIVKMVEKCSKNLDWRHIVIYPNQSEGIWRQYRNKSFKGLKIHGKNDFGARHKRGTNW